MSFASRPSPAPAMDTQYADSQTHKVLRKKSKTNFTANKRTRWSPEAFPRLPWLGFGALLGAMLGIAVSVEILIISNGQPIADWSIQPTVWLSVASTFSNIMLHFALAEGVNVAWWRRAMKEHTQLADLHRNWDFGNSIWAAATAGRHFNLIALACILTAIAPISGPLLQRASRPSVKAVTSPTTLTVSVAPELPFGFTGYVSGRGYYASLFTPNYTSTVLDYNKQTPIYLNRATGCQGICKGTVKGAGLAVNCSSYTVPFDLHPYIFPNGTYDPLSDPALVNGTTVFQTFFQWTHLSGIMTLDIQYKDTSNCVGELVIHNCTMMTAQVEYPVVVDNNTIALDPESTISNDVIDHIINISDPMWQGPATLAGYYLALRNRFDSEAHLRFAGAIGYDLTTTGSAATQYAVTETNDGSSPGNNCSFYFKDPTFDIIASARELMFRTAIAAANSSTIQHVAVSQTNTVAIYLSQYRYLAVASAITAATIVVVTLTFYGYWHLGRKVTMSPIETAKAFNAPLLRNYDSNAPVKSLVKEIGSRSVRYGGITVSAALESDVTHKESLHSTPPQVTSNWQMRLELADEEFVHPPKKGWTFSG